MQKASNEFAARTSAEHLFNRHLISLQGQSIRQTKPSDPKASKGHHAIHNITLVNIM